MLQIEEQDMDKLPPDKNRGQCMQYQKKRTKYDNWVTALESRVRWNVPLVRDMFLY